jgi:undecaprenyl-diphosphatase
VIDLSQAELVILDFIRENLTSPFMDGVMKTITFLGNGGWFWIAVALTLIIIPKTRKIGVTMAVAMILDGIICNLTLKPLIGRIRPYELKGAVDLIIATPSDYSFPSGHSAISFAAASAIFAHSKKWGIPALILALFVALSRLYLYVHFPTDILGGAVVGTLCGTAAYYILKKAYK